MLGLDLLSFSSNEAVKIPNPDIFVKSYFIHSIIEYPVDIHVRICRISLVLVLNLINSTIMDNGKLLLKGMRHGKVST